MAVVFTWYSGINSFIDGSPNNANFRAFIKSPEPTTVVFFAAIHASPIVGYLLVFPFFKSALKKLALINLLLEANTNRVVVINPIAPLILPSNSSSPIEN